MYESAEVSSYDIYSEDKETGKKKQTNPKQLKPQTYTETAFKD